MKKQASVGGWIWKTRSQIWWIVKCEWTWKKICQGRESNQLLSTNGRRIDLKTERNIFVWLEAYYSTRLYQSFCSETRGWRSEDGVWTWIILNDCLFIHQQKSSLFIHYPKYFPWNKLSLFPVPFYPSSLSPIPCVFNPIHWLGNARKYTSNKRQEPYLSHKNCNNNTTIWIFFLSPPLI